MELLLPFLSITVGVALAATTYWVWIMVRRRLWGLDKPVVAETPDGDQYSLEVPALQLRTPVSRRFFYGRRQPGATPPSWDENDQLHPTRMLNQAEGALIVVAPVVFVVVVLFAIVFVLELLLALVLVGVASAIAMILRYRWTVVVTGPYEKANPEEVFGAGRHQVWRIRQPGLRQVHRTRDELAASIRAGDTTVLLAQASVL
jgi:hypothetical protein